MRKQIQTGDNMKYIVDRIEGDYAVCECMGQMYNIPLSSFDQSVTEGDIINEIDGKYVLDSDARDQRKQDIVNKMEDVWE